MKSWQKWAIISIVVLFLIWFLFPKTFERFMLEGFEPKRCEHYFERCLCFGKLTVGKSYPPQYDCLGLKMCNEIDKYIPEDCKYRE